MWRTVTTSLTFAAFLGVLTLVPRLASGAPCVAACKDEVTACVGAQCQGMVRRALKHCRRTCAKSLVRDCYKDLTVCGATQARPTPPAHGGGGGGASGGW